MTSDNDLTLALRRIVGRRHLLSGDRRTARYRTGYRTATGVAALVVRPGSLVALWRVLQACVAADAVVILQAANTGLTGGSTPASAPYDRRVVIVSTTRLRGIVPILGGAQVVCLPGATLNALEARLAPLGREPHSVIGSSCIGASVIGGVCNNSGGALVRRGPAMTELALYARVDASGALVLVNDLGIALGDAPEEILGRLDRGDFGDADLAPADGRRASAAHYDAVVRDVDADTPARFNADPRCLTGASGSAGRVAVFAVRLDTFAAEASTATFHVATDDPAVLTALRGALLAAPGALPIAAEYIHRDAFDLASAYGRDTVHAIRRLGTARLPALFAAKAWADGVAVRLGLREGAGDRLLQRAGRLLPDPLPPRARTLGRGFEHHLLLKVSGAELAATRALLAATIAVDAATVVECTPAEAEALFLHRFAVAGAAVRYRALAPNRVADVVALDVALPRSATRWIDVPPADVAPDILSSAIYGHFLCHVFHRDYIVRRGADVDRVKRRLLEQLDAEGAEYPAEHNVGHSYVAKPALADFYRTLDPVNVMNPGIGQTSRNKHWR